MTATLVGAPPALTLGRRSIGAGQPCYVIAEAGSNHNGDLATAHALIDVAAEAGCDAVKFQVFSAGTLYPPNAGKSDYLGDERSIYDIIAAMELPPQWLEPLHRHALHRGLDFLCSAFDEAGVDRVADYVCAFKCASYEMTHAPLLQHMVRRGKAVLLSTGTATLDEVGEAVGCVRRAVPDPSLALPLVLLQCTAAYPAPPEAAHVRVVQTLRETFGVWSGLSDHTRSHAAAAAAVALGAVVVEKHYTLSNRLPGPDHAFALEPHELKGLVATIRETEKVLGVASKAVDPVEHELRQFARRSVFAIRPIAAGQVLGTDNLAVLRQGKLAAGLAPKFAPLLVGQRAARDIQAWRALQPDDVANCPQLAEPTVRLRRAAPADAEVVWQWNNDPTARAVSIQQDPIPWPSHQLWFARAIADPDQRLWVIEQLGAPCGIVRVRRDAAAAEGTVSIALAESARGKGVGVAALRQTATRYYDETGDRRLLAWIAPDNAASLAAFARAGYQLRDRRELSGRAFEVFELPLPADG